MTWNGKASIAFSKICVVLFAAVAALLVITAPWVTHWFVGFSRANVQQEQSLFMATIYTGAVFIFPILWNLWHLLVQIGKENVFVQENVRRLRVISWCCFGVAVVCLASTAYYLPYLFVAAIAAFMALVVRVVKNIMQQAVALKDEVDYTI